MLSFAGWNHTIRKVKFLSKKSILTKLYNFLGKSKLSTTKKCKSPTFSRVFHPNFFWQFFSWNQSCQQLKSPKPQHFHEFSPKTIRQFFSGNQSWIFGHKMKISNSVTSNWLWTLWFDKFFLQFYLMTCHANTECTRIWGTRWVKCTYWPLEKKAKKANFVAFILI